MTHQTQVWLILRIVILPTFNFFSISSASVDFPNQGSTSRSFFSVLVRSWISRIFLVRTAQFWSVDPCSWSRQAPDKSNFHRLNSLSFSSISSDLWLALSNRPHDFINQERERGEKLLKHQIETERDENSEIGRLVYERESWTTRPWIPVRGDVLVRG